MWQRSVTFGCFAVFQILTQFLTGCFSMISPKSRRLSDFSSFHLIRDGMNNALGIQDDNFVDPVWSFETFFECSIADVTEIRLVGGFFRKISALRVVGELVGTNKPVVNGVFFSVAFWTGSVRNNSLKGVFRHVFCKRGLAGRDLSNDNDNFFHVSRLLPQRTPCSA